MDPLSLIHTLFLAPLAASGLILLSALRRPRLAASLSLLANALTLVATFFLLQQRSALPIEATFNWIELSSFSVNIGYYVTPQALLMLFIVSFLGFWIQLFSTAYMKDDPSQGRYFAGISFFLFAMLGIVLADNLFMLFIFWELVGLGSYMLIAHYWETDAAAQASKKAFIVNRIGDWGFLLGILGAFWHYGTTQLSTLQALAQSHPSGVSALIALLLICGFIGKSAQLPLQVWLPDAMAGPTPVSALIHAATMVAAGIYMLCRIEALLPESALTLIACMGTLMTLYAGLCALSQRDIKRILAYSTLSQLGYMAAVFGLGYSGLALMHLSTHAFFKALLFLGAGAIIAQTHHEQDIFKLGGLLRRMPFTAGTFAIGSLALMGAGAGDILLSSGGASKHLILEAAWLKSPGHYALLCASSFITALYVGRLFWIVFLGQERGHGAKKATEAPLLMLIPLCVLALYSVFIGFRTLMPTGLAALFDADILRVEALIEHLGPSSAKTWIFLKLLPNFAWVAGLACSLFYLKNTDSQDPLAARSPALHKALGAFPSAFDNFYQSAIVKPQNILAHLLHILDIIFLRGMILGSLSIATRAIGHTVLKLNTGNLSTYAHWTLGGLATLAVLVFLS